MYHPYFRGKQFELVTIRENAKRFAANKFTPIIEPVKQEPTGLLRALEALKEAGSNGIVVVNPQDGFHKGGHENLPDVVSTYLGAFPAVICGVLLTETMSTADAMSLIGSCTTGNVALIHAGFKDAKGLSKAIAGLKTVTTSIFVDGGNRRKLYEQYFTTQQYRVLLRDGFKRRQRNRDYPRSEPFSDLHATYKSEGMTGFGDYLMVGDEFLESGGPAYAVAIHMTYIDPDQDGEMMIFHFLSDTQDTPTDPAGKFAEALQKLIKEADQPGSKLAKTEAMAEFRSLHKRGHYPGLGFVKKLSMSHHIETLALYLAE